MTAVGTVPQGRVWGAALAGLAALLLGIGLGRFAYAPLLPALIEAGWFTAPAAAYLGAANLAGYLAGALLGAALARRWSAGAVLRGAMLVATLSFVGCAWPVGFAWFFVWRFAAGMAGAVLMVLAAPTALGITPVDRRGRVSGIVFTGVGIGIGLSGVLVPVLAPLDLTAAWLGLAALGALLTVSAWPAWPASRPVSGSVGADAGRQAGQASFGLPVLLLLAAYAGDALGFVPHTLFWVDYVARGLGQGLAAGGVHWVIFGLGASVGALLVGLVADRIGFASSISLAFLVKGAAVLLPLFSSTPMALAISGAVVGALTPGTSALVSGRVAELVGTCGHASVWGWMTTAFAVAQAAGAYGFAWLFDVTGGYRPLFAIAGASLVAAALLAAVSARAAGRSALPVG